MRTFFRMALFESKFYWCLELEEKFLMIVMDYPCIYETRIPEYRNAEVKANAFTKIAKAIGCGKYSTVVAYSSLTSFH